MVWQRVTSHPLAPIVIGVFLAMDTAGNVALKGYGFIFLWVWLCVDVALWLQEKKQWPKLWRLVLIQAIYGLSVTVALASIFWLLELKLQEKQEDVYRNLSGSVSLPPGENPIQSLFP